MVTRCKRFVFRIQVDSIMEKEIWGLNRDDMCLVSIPIQEECSGEMSE